MILTQPPSSRAGVALYLSEAEDRVGILAEACLTAGQKIARALSTLQQCQHHCQFALSPISGLPVETMFRIFEFAVTGSFDPPADPLDASTSILLISQVCYSWRGTARAHKPLWTHFSIDQRTPVEVFDQHVKISAVKPSSRDLYFSLLEPEENRALRTMHSLKTLAVQRPHSCALCGQNEAGSDCYFLQGVEFPHLSDLTLDSVTIAPQTFMRAPTLVSLHLYSVATTITSLNAMLRSLSTLESLKLASIHDFSSHDADDDGGTEFTLPRLQNLSTHELDLKMLRFILQTERYPALLNLDYRGSSTRSSLSRPSTMRRLLRTLFKNLHGSYDSILPVTWISSTGSYIFFLPTHSTTPLLLLSSPGPD